MSSTKPGTGSTAPKSPGAAPPATPPPTTWPEDYALPPRPPRGLGRKLRTVFLPEATGPCQPRLGATPKMPPADGERVGICCSGGGLRSASFALGGLSVLWRQGILRRADLLAGVSGGSYAVTAATMVRTQSTDVDWSSDETPAPFGIGSPELDYLRNRTDYLAPGIMGRWNMFIRLVTGILVNLAVINAVVWVLAAVVGRLYGEWFPGLAENDPLQRPVHRSADLWIVLGLLTAGVACSLVDLFFRPADDVTWRRLVRWSGTLLFAALVAAFALYAVPLLVWALRNGKFGLPSGKGVSNNPTARGVASSLVAMVAAGLPLLLGRGQATIAKVGKLRKASAKLFAVLQKLLIAVLAPLGLLAVFLSGVDVGSKPWTSRLTVGVIVAGVLLVLFFRAANPIAWSAQPFYKRRLRTVFCVKRERQDDGTVVAAAIPYGHEPELPALKAEGWPELLICASANVSDTGMTPPGLGVTSFVFTADRLGGPLVGSVSTTEYAEAIRVVRGMQKLRKRLSPRYVATSVRDLSPLSAVSISGAAVAPSMGRMNMPAYRMLITLFNLRLGVWLPNPRLVKTNAWDRKRLVRPGYLLKEMLGSNGLTSPFLYVSDGGHYENLGLVELLRRGCTLVYCLDASGDPPGGNHTLGQALALARSELGVTIDVSAADLALVDGSDTLVEAAHTVATIHFPDGRTGTLVYMRKSLTADGPLDLLAYQKARPVFPYDGTGDQFYDVEQFEAYRALGEFVATRALADSAVPRPASMAT